MKTKREKLNGDVVPMDSPKKFQLTPDLIQQCRAEFEANISIRQMEMHAQQLQNAGRFREALQLHQQEEALFSKVLVAYQKQIESQVENVRLSEANIPHQDLVAIERLMVTLFMAVDIMDSCLMDINDTLHHTDEGMFFEKLDDLRSMAIMCREQLAQFHHAGTYLKQTCWGDITDDMYTMMQQKAKAIMRKTSQASKLKT